MAKACVRVKMMLMLVDVSIYFENDAQSFEEM